MFYVEVLTPSILEYDIIRRQDLYRHRTGGALTKGESLDIEIGGGKTL